MPLRCGIVGLPNIGKSTVFNALTAANALAANYPFATKEPNVGVITVPDPRLEQLFKTVNPKKKSPTTVEILDIAGLIKGASQGEGLGNKFLANIREVDAIVHVVRCFEDDNVIHVDGSVDPVRDKEIVDLELLFKDIETMEKRIEKLEKQSKSGDKEDLRRLELAKEIKAYLEAGKPARLIQLTKEDAALMHNIMLLTDKPVLYVCNVDENAAVDGNVHTQQFMEAIKDEDAEVILVSAAIEEEIAKLEDDEEKLVFLEEMGLHEPGIHRLIRASYKLLHLITFFTAGPKEVHAWTVKDGTKAPQAAGAIHTDFEKGFIRAEVIKHEDFIRYGSEHAVKELGKMSVEGKDYVVQDGDVIYFRFNV